MATIPTGCGILSCGLENLYCFPKRRTRENKGQEVVDDIMAEDFLRLNEDMSSH